MKITIEEGEAIVSVEATRMYPNNSEMYMYLFKAALIALTYSNDTIEDIILTEASSYNECNNESA